ncbi:PAS-domain containing protein [Paracoccus pacificus]|uniref:histidine kinase n=1 Tax=Paracoccus pacificus TaxID=1463598 RepID=A0ABW4R4K3_9RHOB
MIDDKTRAELTRSGLNLIQQAISIFDADLRLVVSNRPYQVMFDLPDALTRIGTTFEDTIRHMVERGEYGPQDDPEAAVRWRVDQARAFQPHYMERDRPNGRTISVEGSPLKQGGWVTVYTDITGIRTQQGLLRARSDALSEQLLDHAERLAAANRELAATNAALVEAQRVLTESESRMRQVTEMVPAHIARMDADETYTFSNFQLPTVMPGTRADVVGRTGLEVLGPETWARIRPHYRAALAGRQQVFEMTHPPSGRRIRIALTPDRAGSGIFVLSADVTAEVQSREALTHTARRALGAALTSGMAHDFGNLLTIILGMQGRLAAADLPPDLSDHVQATLAAARRGAGILGRIADITAPRVLDPRPVDPGRLLHELAAMVRPTLGDSIVLDLITDLGSGAILLDPAPLQDSLLNLILNARDALGPAGGRIQVVARQRPGDWLEIAVQDDGAGFTEQALSQATQPFFSTKPGQGSGLGLSMVYDQTKLAGGTLRLENRPEGGARVTLRLPFAPAPAQAPLMVLLVEDDADIRAATRQMLRDLGHSVIEAGSRAEAMALFDLPGLDMVLSDIQLGDGTGIELMAALPPGIARVLMSSLPATHVLRLDAPCPVLQKPFDVAALRAMLTQVLDE